MKHIIRKTLSVVAILAAISIAVTAHAETIETRIGKLSFTHDFASGYPTRETIEKLYDERDFQRACQAYLWALPIVAMAQAQKDGARAFPEVGEFDFALAIGHEAVLGVLTPNVVTP